MLYFTLAVFDIALCADKHYTAVRTSVLLNLTDPLIDSLEALEVSNRVANKSAHRLAVVSLSDRIILFLTRCVVKLHVQLFVAR